MKRIFLVFFIILGTVSFSNKKDSDIVLPDIERQMEKADKIESFKAKKDLAWHKSEYGKTIKFLNKSKE